MSTEEKQTPDEAQISNTPAAEAAPAAPPKDLNPKKKRALLTYMTILFVVAFLLVLLSFFIQLRDSRATISELNESSLNALKNAQVLQAANEQLAEENKELNDQLSTYEEENTQLTETLEQAQQTAQQTALAYELLAQAQLARQAQDEAALAAALQALEQAGGEAVLSEQGRALLDSLRGAEHTGNGQ